MGYNSLRTHTHPSNRSPSQLPYWPVVLRLCLQHTSMLALRRCRLPSLLPSRLPLRRLCATKQAAEAEKAAREAFEALPSKLREAALELEKKPEMLQPFFASLPANCEQGLKGYVQALFQSADKNADKVRMRCNRL